MKTVSAKRRCVNPFSSDVFEEFGPVDDSGSFGGSWEEFLSDSCGLSEGVLAVSSGVLVETRVSVSVLSVGALGEVFLSDSDCETVKPQSSPFSRKRRAFHVEKYWRDECGEFGRRRASVVKKEDTTSGH